MKISKRLMLPMAAIALLGASAAGVGVVSAATDGQPGTLAQRIATSFNLDPAKVQAVIDESHKERHQKHAADHEAQDWAKQKQH